MAVVFAVRNTASLVRFQSSVRAWNASRNAPAAPTPADSVAVVMPNRMTASTTTVRMPSGMIDEVTSFTTSKPLGVHLRVVAHLQQRQHGGDARRTSSRSLPAGPLGRSGGSAGQSRRAQLLHAVDRTSASACWWMTTYHQTVAKRAGDDHERHQGVNEILDQHPVADAAAVGLDLGRLRRREQRLDQRDQDIVRIGILRISAASAGTGTFVCSSGNGGAIFGLIIAQPTM